MTVQQHDKALAFRSLHEQDSLFVMPNAWNAGSAILLEQEGFAAIGTTSAGIAFCLGLSDYDGSLSRDTAMAETGRIANATALPVSVDGENGYGHDADTVAESIGVFAATGAVGASIEDYSGDEARGLYDVEHAIERIKAARQSADELDFPFTLTARAECYLVGHQQPFAESVRRANAYREAGADCLYVPGVRDINEIAQLATEINGPLNVVMGLSGKPVTIAQLRDAGIRRVSIGGSLARATMGLIRSAARELNSAGTFGYADGQIPDSELCELFAGRR